MSRDAQASCWLVPPFNLNKRTYPVGISNIFQILLLHEFCDPVTLFNHYNKSTHYVHAFAYKRIKRVYFNMKTYMRPTYIAVLSHKPKLGAAIAS